MRSIERGGRHETLEKAISRIAFAYGFSLPPIMVSRKAIAALPNASHKTATALSVMKQSGKSTKPLQVWGGARSGRGMTLSFGTLATKSALGNALIVKTALSVAELAGFKNPTVSVSSIGDNESKKRFTRELTNYFKKHLESLPADVKPRALHDPDAVYRELVTRKDPAIERAPRSIDYLSENARKSMLDNLALFESVGIAYTIDPRLLGEAGISTDLLIAIDAEERDGSKVRIAEGSRIDEAARKAHGIESDSATALSLSLPRDVELAEETRPPACFVVHIGEAAKLKAFTLLEALWRSHISLTQTLMAENLKEQMDAGKTSGAKYLAIIGQREALDNTIIVRNAATQMQVTLPLEKLEAYVSRVRS